jgi:hypothetical protein
MTIVFELPGRLSPPPGYRVSRIRWMSRRQIEADTDVAVLRGRNAPRSHGGPLVRHANCEEELPLFVGTQADVIQIGRRYSVGPVSRSRVSGSSEYRAIEQVSSLLPRNCSF